MSGSDFSKKAAVVSGSVIVVWLLSLLLIGLYWNHLSEYSVIFFSWSVTVMIIGGLFILAADIMLLKGMNSKVSLLISLAVTAVMPIAVITADSMQRYSLSGYDMYDRYSALHAHGRITDDLPYLFYASAAVAVTAAAVRTFTGTEFPRIASRVSEYAIVIGVALQPLLIFFILTVESVMWKWTEYISFSVIAVCLAGMLVFAAVVMMRRNKGGAVPLAVSSAAAVLLPFMTEMLSNFQEILASCDEDTLYTEEWQLYLKYSEYAETFSYIVYIGIVIAAAAAAVRFFSEKETAGRAEFTEISYYE